MEPAQNPQPSAAADHTVPAFTAAQQKPCPFCAELINAAAIKCKHCGSDLRPGASTHEARQQPASGALTVGRLAFLAVVVWMLFKTVVQWALSGQGTLHVAMPAWNSIILVGTVAIAVGLFRRAEWARGWGMGTAVMTLISDGLNLMQQFRTDPINETAVALIALGMCAAAVARYGLGQAAAEFVDPSAYAPDGVPVLTDRTKRSDIWITAVLVGGAVLVSIIAQT